MSAIEVLAGGLAVGFVSGVWWSEARAKPRAPLSSEELQRVQHRMAIAQARYHPELRSDSLYFRCRARARLKLLKRMSPTEYGQLSTLARDTGATVEYFLNGRIAKSAS